MKKLLIAALLLSTNAYADLIFDWTGTCRPLSCVRAWGEFRMDDSYIPGTEIAEPGPSGDAHSPKLKSFVLNFDYGLAVTAPKGISGPPVSVVGHFIDTFAMDFTTGNPNLFRLEGALPQPSTPTFRPFLLLWQPESGDYFFFGDYNGGLWGGPFTSKHIGVSTPEGFVLVEPDWPTGTNSLFTLRQAQVAEPSMTVLLLGALLVMCSAGRAAKFAKVISLRRA